MKILVFLLVTTVAHGMDNSTDTEGSSITVSNNQNETSTSNTTASKQVPVTPEKIETTQQSESKATKQEADPAEATQPTAKDERQGSGSCAEGLFGTDCSIACGFCAGADKKPVACESNGGCPTASQCLEGWKGEKCSEAICDPVCQNDRPCIAPNTCDCGEDINYIAPICEDIRLRGLIGPLIAIITITVSISLCGFASKVYVQSKAKQQPLE